MKPLLCLLLLAPLLSGCAMRIADHIKAREQVEKSQDAYRTCVAQNLSNTERCKPLKDIYDADRAAFEGR